ncbi:MAG TPA: NAD(+)/NADH kinase [Nocardioidaceae bacterium]|nr:NAD(+)/NADH kinase [Nocardioidaceae bacterium]
MTTLVGLVANPLAGRDIRRITAGASLVPNHEKSAIVSRLLAGLAAAGVDTVRYLPDRAGVVRAALDGTRTSLTTEPLAMHATGRVEDSTEAARLLARDGAAVIVTLGGDGTNRAVAAGCGEVPLIAVSTGTNNVFPTMVDGTVAGLAAGLVATGRVGGDAVRRTKRVEVAGDFALIDAASCRDRFVGARAIWDPQKVQALVLARAEPWSVGLSAIGGALCPVTTDDPCGLWVELGNGGRVVSVPVAPGLVLPVPVRRWRRLDLEEPVPLGEGPGTIALDGERELGVDGATAAKVTRTGPWLVDIRETLRRGSADD